MADQETRGLPAGAGDSARAGAAPPAVCGGGRDGDSTGTVGVPCEIACREGLRDIFGMAQPPCGRPGACCPRGLRGAAGRGLCGVGGTKDCAGVSSAGVEMGRDSPGWPGCLRGHGCRGLCGVGGMKDCAGVKNSAGVDGNCERLGERGSCCAACGACEACATEDQTMRPSTRPCRAGGGEAGGDCTGAAARCADATGAGVRAGERGGDCTGQVGG
mmetsp:Transcript_88114/g.285160  ORF Transcript_88114/g.285160 Transcript_88114/m.285160 type:complete len:216 (+) Transcript_88114:475-1122(+)